MKTTLTLLLSALTVGCTVYPKNYTYNPNVTVTGNQNGGDVQLPNPFARSHKQHTVIKKTYNATINNLQEREPSVYNTYVTRPPQTANYYYSDMPDVYQVHVAQDHQNPFIH